MSFDMKGRFTVFFKFSNLLPRLYYNFLTQENIRNEVQVFLEGWSSIQTELRKLGNKNDYVRKNISIL